MSTLIHKVTLVAATTLTSIALVACGGETSAPNKASDPSAGAAKGQDNGRAFNSTDDAVAIAIKAATRADKVEWDGKKLVVHFDSGSVEDPMARISCSAIDVLLGEDETGMVVYSDGEIECSEQ